MKHYLPQGITRDERTGFLNTRMRSVQPGICIERAKLITQSYKQTEGEPYIIRRAKGLAHILRNMTIFIDEEELIVGNHAGHPRWAPLYPETNRLSEYELDMFPVRKVDTLQITKEAKETLLKEIYPYWENKCTEDFCRKFFPEEILDVLSAKNKVFDPMSRTRSGYGHYIQNNELIITKGFSHVAQQAEEKLRGLAVVEEDYADKVLFYKAVLIICEGVKCFAQRFEDLARRMAQQEHNERRKKELCLIADACAVVPYHPAQNYHQALQAYWFTVIIDYIFQNGSAISTGRFDQYIYPYYLNDIESGLITRDDAQELLEALWVKHSDVIKAGTLNSAKNNGGFATTIALTLSGISASGSDATNEFTYLCLDAERTVFNCEPNIGIRVGSSTPDNVITKALQILVEHEGGKLPFFNDDIVVPALCADGAQLDDAREYGIVGCVEPAPSGNCMAMSNTCYFNLAKCLELALNNGVCMLSGEQMGPKTGDPENFSTFQDVLDAYEGQMQYFVKTMVGTIKIIEEVNAAYTPHIYPSILIDGCMESGKDATMGGGKYNYNGVQGVGMQDVADSLTAIKTLVYEEKAFSLSEVAAALRRDFEGQEHMRQMLIHKAPKYGNDEIKADEMAAYVAKLYCDTVRSYKNWRQGQYRPGLFCLSSNTPLGRNTAALPSGRKAKTPLADGGISPKHGMDTKGPTAVCQSAARLNHALATNGVNLNQKILPSILKTPQDLQKLVDLVRGYFNLGGMHIQFNILNGDTLRKAQENPEDYRGLVVRVAGYSAFFVEIDRDIQNEIIARTEQMAI